MPALIFDCDGVLADTERYGHLPAFNLMFAELGVPVSWSEQEYGDLLKIGGGKERMASALTAGVVGLAGLPTDEAGQAELLRQWHRRKTDIYTALVESGVIPPRSGVRRLTAEALDAGWKVAVASTSAEQSVRAVLVHVVGPSLASRVDVFAGDVVARKKPAPDIYELAVSSLDVPVTEAAAVEDSRNGMVAALGAGLACAVTTSSYTQHEDFSGAGLVVSSLGDPLGDGPWEGDQRVVDVPFKVLDDPLGLRPAGFVRLDDIRRMLDIAAETLMPPQRQGGSV